MPESWIGDGKLGVAFGARGHGFAAAHYEIELHVINLTRFNGPGSISHECCHALDSRFAKRWLGRTGLFSDIVERDQYKARCAEETKYRDRFDSFIEIVRACTKPSKYVDNAIKLESQKGAPKYWSKSSELCARSFESFIQDKLIEMGVKHQWLAFGTLETDYPMNGMHPYPTGEDRRRLNDVWNKHIPVLFSRHQKKA